MNNISVQHTQEEKVTVFNKEVIKPFQTVVKLQKGDMLFVAKHMKNDGKKWLFQVYNTKYNDLEFSQFVKTKDLLSIFRFFNDAYIG